ncbi:hypothetical protein Nepgr_008615 [Nepenthes gracilis]|uniref:Denticleless protein homolog n=1 Tax=Nepenthes gracilis TaxID=150966 RepID=A0AAD3S9D7_NEPGR|nr:hypothetical protein Nepgr_008615 [Nepenthes gracilis]
MEVSKSQSIFQDIKSRELSGLRVRKRPYFSDNSSDQIQPSSEALAIGHGGEETPPLAVSFCKTIKHAHILAVSDEDGYVSLFDTRSKLSSFRTCQEKAEKARVSDWSAHQNAVFDICWIKDDAQILTASGDQTIKLWDAQERKCTRVLTGHTGSIKSVCSHPTKSDLVVSGSRDGSFALWDLRCEPSHGRDCIKSIGRVNRAHISTQGRRTRRVKAASMSITSVLYLKDEVFVATAGAVDSVVKFWDTRNLRAQVTQTCPHSEWEVQMSAISPDASHMLSGSTDGKTYIWQVNKPEADPIALTSHEGEVTAVDWCLQDVGKVSTASDDFTVRFWDIQSSLYVPARSHSVRRRVMAIPSLEASRLALEREPMSIVEGAPSTSCPPDEVPHFTNSPELTKIPEISTPESNKKYSSSFNTQECFEKTPEAALRSPSSVLCSLSTIKKKTIRDYFLSAS